VGIMENAAKELETTELRVLLVEDSDYDAELTTRLLRAAGYQVRLERVMDEQAMRGALNGRLPDLVLSDFSMPAFDGMSALAIARVEAADVPFIFLSGTIGEERAIEALKSGATDYILKGNSKRLGPAVKRALADAEQRRARQLAERQVVRLTGVLEMLSGINAAVVRIQDRDVLLNESCRLAHRIGSYALSMVALINPATRMARPVGWAGHELLAAPDQEFRVADREDQDTSLIGRVIRTGQAALCEDIRRPAFVIDRQEELIGAGIRSLACVPLRVDGTPVGAFLCGTASPGIGAEELLLLEELAGTLSFALQYLEKQDEVKFLSYFEPLTGLAKRALFCERLTRLVQQGRSSQLALAVFDIEHLSVINDSFGRHTGDRLLQCVAERLRGHFLETEQLAHLGGGTFLTMRTLPERAKNESPVLLQDLARIFDRPFSVDGRDITVTVKSGLAEYPEDGKEAHELVQNAEAALKEARSVGAPHLHHRIEMNSELARRVAMENRLRTALEAEQFVLYYQPKMTLRTGKIASVEALLRWQDPQQGLVAPGLFLPLLESAGLMSAVGAWVLKRAVSDCRRWRRLGLPPVRVAVNISPPELKRGNIASEILDHIGDLLGDRHWGIDVEVTEGTLVGDSSACIDSLELLRAAGVGVAIDDFGTGFSSLGRLSELPIDTLKIDRTFTARVPGDRKGCMLVSTIIGLARAFDMTTVAEGVETQQQLDYLVQEGCDESQGYLHSRPVPREEFERLLRS
jgi:diguanylate cyclase (GGDEF)-like protein